MASMLLFAGCFFFNLPAATYASTGPALNISVQVSDSNGNVTSVIAPGRQMLISTNITNMLEEGEDFPFVVLSEIRDRDGISLFLAWQSGSLKPQASVKMGFSWLQDKSDEYVIRTLAVSNLDNPAILTQTQFSPLIVTTDSSLVTNATQRFTVLNDISIPFGNVLTDQNHRAAQIAEQHKKLCGEEYRAYTSQIAKLADDDPSLEYWYPRQMQFQHLLPREPIYIQPCLFESDSQAQEFANYLVKGNDTIRVEDSMAIDLVAVETPEQAVEFLSYFTFDLEQGKKIGIIPSVDDYSAWSRECPMNTDSPIRSIRVTEYYNGENHPIIVEVNVADLDTGSLEYQKWRFDSNSEPPLLISKLKFGQCVLQT